MTIPVLTVEALNAREAKLAERRGTLNYRFRSVYRLPTDDERLFTSSKVAGQCLTHITRHVSESQRRADSGNWEHHHLTFTGWCGTQMSSARLVPVADEMFACHACITRGEHFEQDTFNLIPSTGCEASEGKRRGRRLNRKDSE